MLQSLSSSCQAVVIKEKLEFVQGKLKREKLQAFPVFKVQTSEKAIGVNIE